MTPAFDAVAFDVDGTIMDSTELSVFILLKTLEEVGQPVFAEDMDFARHSTDMEIWEHFGLAHRADEMQERLAGNQEILWGQEKPFPGVWETMTLLKEWGITVAMVSNRTDAQILEDYVLSPYLYLADFWVSCETAGAGKPDPAPLRHFLEKAGCEPAGGLLVGDARPDTEACRGAGMPFALALWGAAEKNLPADYRLKKPVDLLKVVWPRCKGRGF